MENELKLFLDLYSGKLSASADGIEAIIALVAISFFFIWMMTWSADALRKKAKAWSKKLWKAILLKIP